MKHIKNGVIGRALAGWHFTYMEKYTEACYLSGQNSQSKISSTGGDLFYYLNQAPNGTLVYDAQDCDQNAIKEYVFKGPMHDPCLDPIFGKTKDFLPKDIKTKPIVGMIGASGETMTFAEAAYLGSEAFLQYLKETIPNLKTGKVYNKQVIWD